MNLREWWRFRRARARTRAMAREQRRRAELTACAGYVSPRWVQAHHYQSGQRRDER